MRGEYKNILQENFHNLENTCDSNGVGGRSLDKNYKEHIKPTIMKVGRCNVWEAITEEIQIIKQSERNFKSLAFTERQRRGQNPSSRTGYYIVRSEKNWYTNSKRKYGFELKNRDGNKLKIWIKEQTKQPYNDSW